MCVWVRSFRAPVRASGIHGLTQLYRGAWDNDCHTRVPFFYSQKKRKKKKEMYETEHEIKIGQIN